MLILEGFQYLKILHAVDLSFSNHSKH